MKNVRVYEISRIQKGNKWKFDFASVISGSTIIYCSEESNLGIVEKEGKEGFQKSTGNLKDLLNLDLQKFIYLSSSVVYLNPFRNNREKDTFNEKSRVFSDSWYKKKKLKSEELVRKSGFGSILRLANVYGLGNMENNIFGDLLSQFFSCDKPNVLNVRDSSPIRDYIYISDVIDAILATEKKGKFGIYNIGSGEGTSVKELAFLFSSILDQKIDKIVSENKKKNNSSLILDLKKINLDTGWEPKVRLKEGIRKLINFKKNNVT
jgi:UDP-glucose 4-epimerase